MTIPPHPARSIRSAMLTAAMLAGCAVPAPTPGPGADTDPATREVEVPQRYEDLPPQAVYRIVASALTVKVYRAGPLKQFGHDHLITSTAVRGAIHLPESDEGISAGFADLYLPVASLVVDDPAERARAGGDFVKTVPDSDRNGTRANLLGPRVLDALNHPRISVAVAPLSRSTAQLQISFKGAPHGVVVPVQWTRGGGDLDVSSDFTLTHAELGLTPFTILGGAIAVADRIEVSLTLSAALTPLSHAGT